MSYREQFYNEGFGTTFYLKPIKYIRKKVKNKKAVKLLLMIVKILYTIVFISLAIVMFILNFPL